MRGLNFVCVVVLLFFSWNPWAQAENENPSPEARVCPSPWLGSADGKPDCALLPMTLQTTYRVGESIEYVSISASIRAGYLQENLNKPFRGNIIYYEGLGDSMLNHMPLFQELTDAGYRVIAFDYMGQGGSSGTMGDTRIPQIADLGNEIWKTYAYDLANYPKKTMIGWSTGGLAAYMQAAEEKEEATVVLIAPGICPNFFVGDQDVLHFKINQITLSSLTTQKYPAGSYNPHIDPIKPASPASFALLPFVSSLLLNAKKSQEFDLNKDPQVHGFVLLSGTQDTYVDANETRKVLQTQAK